MFLYSGRSGIEPERYLAFVETFKGWLEEGSETERRPTRSPAAAEPT